MEITSTSSVVSQEVLILASVVMEHILCPTPQMLRYLSRMLLGGIKAEEALSMEKYLIKYRAELEQRIAQAAALLPKVKPVRKARPYVSY